MCGGDSGQDPVVAAQQAEAERQAKIDAATAQINSLFASPTREAQYADFLAANRGLYTKEVNDQHTDAVRDNKFALARNGQTGGSLAIDRGNQLGETFQKAIIDSERLAQGKDAELRGQDQQSRLSLTQMIQSGLDATTASQNASSAMANNLSSSSSTRTVQDLGDIFKQYATFYTKSADAKAQRQGDKYAYDTLYKPGLFSGYQTG